MSPLLVKIWRKNIAKKKLACTEVINSVHSEVCLLVFLKLCMYIHTQTSEVCLHLTSKQSRDKKGADFMERYIFIICNAFPVLQAVILDNFSKCNRWTCIICWNVLKHLQIEILLDWAFMSKCIRIIFKVKYVEMSARCLLIHKMRALCNV